MTVNPPPQSAQCYTVRTRDGVIKATGLSALDAARAILKHDWRVTRLELTQGQWTLVGIKATEPATTTVARAIIGPKGSLSAVASDEMTAWKLLALDIIQHCFCWRATLEAVLDQRHRAAFDRIGTAEIEPSPQIRYPGSRRLVVYLPAELTNTHPRIPNSTRIATALYRLRALVDATRHSSKLTPSDLELLQTVLGHQLRPIDPDPLGSLYRAYQDAFKCTDTPELASRHRSLIAKLKKLSPLDEVVLLEWLDREPEGLLSDQP